MTIPNPFKAQKLTISVVGDKTKKFEAMFNPSQYTITRQIKWNTPAPLTPTVTPPSNVITPSNNSTQAGAKPKSDPTPQPTEPVFGGIEYGSFGVKLILDGTGASESGLLTGFGLKIKSVKERVQEFLNVCYHIIEEKHGPNKVFIQWGEELKRTAVLQSITINYTLFDSSGNALRAELDTSFKLELEDVKLASPDLTHTREVHEGDTLPLLSKEIYGSSRYYLFVAEANKLDDFRNLKAGTKLYFPPLENQI